MNTASSKEVVFHEAREVRTALNRMAVEELRKLCSRWGVRGCDKLEKDAVVQLLLEDKLKSGLTHRQVAEMDLTQCLAQPVSKTWHVCKLCGDTQEEEAVVPTVKPAELEAALNRELNLYYKQYTAVRNIRGQTWVRIGIEEERWRGKKRVQAVFIVHHARSHFIFHTQMGKAQLPYILAALRVTFPCRDIRPIDLKGRDLNALVKLCLEKVGRYSAKSLAHIAGGTSDPLLPARTEGVARKRRRKSDADTVVLDEDRKSKSKRKVAMVEVYGVEQAPALQCIEFKVKGGYKGSYDVAGPFHMHVRFEGPNVVDGFREMVEHEMAQLPLPDHIANLAENAKTSIEVDVE